MITGRKWRNSRAQKINMCQTCLLTVLCLAIHLTDVAIDNKSDDDDISDTDSCQIFPWQNGAVLSHFSVTRICPTLGGATLWRSGLSPWCTANKKNSLLHSINVLLNNSSVSTHFHTWCHILLLIYQSNAWSFTKKAIITIGHTAFRATNQEVSALNSSPGNLELLVNKVLIIF